MSGYPADWASLRETALRRDGYRCGNCGGSVGLNVHHVVPLGYGGSNRLENLTTLCSDCHLRSHGKFGRIRGRRLASSSKPFSFSGPALLSGMVLTFIGIAWMFSLPMGQISPADPFLILIGATFGTILVELIYRSDRPANYSQLTAARTVSNASNQLVLRPTVTYSFSVPIDQSKPSGGSQTSSAE